MRASRSLSYLGNLPLALGQMLKRLFILLALVISAGSAQAEAQVSPEVAVVSRLYRDFAWEAVLREPIPREPTFIDQSKQVLGQYLDPGLVRLLMADRACAAKSRMICNLDFDPIWASQNPAASSLRVHPGKRSGSVDVSFLYPCGKAISLRFEMIETPSGPRIRDIHYADGPSLLTTLNRKP